MDRASDPSRAPGTLIGHFLLAHALGNHAQLALLKRDLSVSGWRNARRVIIAAVYEAANLRWPGNYESHDVQDFVDLAVAIAPRRELIDKSAIEWVVRDILGETLESSIGERSEIASQLYVFWAFMKLLDLDPAAIGTLIAQAEERVVGRGYIPTPAPASAGNDDDHTSPM